MAGETCGRPAASLQSNPVSDDEQLSSQLASLHIQRDAPRSSGRGNLARWLVVLVALGGLGGVGYWALNRGEARLFPDEVELGAVTLVSPQQENVTLVATGYVNSRRKA